MKTSKTLLAIAAVLASTSAFAVDMSTSITTGTTHSVRDVNTQVSGEIISNSFEYKQNRGAALGDVNGNGCTGAACGGIGNDSLSVGIEITASTSTTLLDQLTTGQVSTATENCDVTVAIGGIQNSQGTRIATTSGETVTQANNITTTISGTVSVNTLTEENYLGGGWSKPGNDVDLVVGGHKVNTEGDSVNVAALHDILTNADGFTVSVGGQDLAHSDMNAFDVSWSTEVVTIEDMSKTTTTTDSVTTTIYENLN
jgi:hypothetical protein